MKHQINFRNAVQAALFTCELSGQISDGMWENAKPHNHWRGICDAEVAVNPTQPGCNFYPVKNNYNFTSSELLKIIGDRMLNIANMAENGLPMSIIRDFNDYNPLSLHYPGNDYWVDKRARFDLIFGDAETFKKECTGSYDMAKLRRELKDMQTIIKTVI